MMVFPEIRSRSGFALFPALLLAAASLAGEMQNVSLDTDVQDLKDAVLDLNQELFLLEE